MQPTPSNPTARIGRLGGALLVQSAGNFHLVGNLKQPCDFAAAGFEKPPVEIDALTQPVLTLQRCGEVVWGEKTLECHDHPALPQILAERMLITRNGGVSERLWNLLWVAEASPAGQAGDVTWLLRMPAGVWGIVRDTVLKCS